MMSRSASRLGRAGIVVSVIGLLGLALGYGIAQSTVVTQAEWAVYMAQGLGLDWNLPPNAKSNHYIERLAWANSIEFRAAQMLDGSTATPLEDGSVQSEPGEPSEALYRMATLRAGDYGFRVKLGGGGAVLKVSDQAYELFQPDTSARWVDVDRVPLNPGEHPMSLMLLDGARAESLGVTPPCMTPVQPSGGWRPLDPLTFHEMAVTLAKALDLERNLPELGDPISILGEEFRITLIYPYKEEVADVSEDDPYWLSSGGAIVTAVARFEVPEDGIYSIETRYLSPRAVPLGHGRLPSCGDLSHYRVSDRTASKPRCGARRGRARARGHTSSRRQARPRRRATSRWRVGGVSARRRGPRLQAGKQ